MMYTDYRHNKRIFESIAVFSKPVRKSWLFAMLLFSFNAAFPNPIFAQDRATGGDSLEGVAIISHPSAVVSILSQRELDEFFTLEANKWKDGALVVVFEHKQRSASKEIFYHYLGREPREMKKIWMRVILSGEGRAPKTLNSEEEVLRRVSETPSSIGYIRASLVTDDVQVLMVISDDATHQGIE